jgi:hypothetical protein
VRRLEPGDIGLALVVVGGAEADKGLHLVPGAADGPGEVVGARHVRVGGDVQQVRRLLQPPEQAIEQREPLVRPVQDHLVGELQEGARDGERGRLRSATT